MPAFGAWGFADIYKELFPQGEAAHPHRRRVSHACSFYQHEEFRYAAFQLGASHRNPAGGDDDRAGLANAQIS